jgi:hypothetical protein
MRLPCPRFSLLWLMVAVAITGLNLAGIALTWRGLSSLPDRAMMAALVKVLAAALWVPMVMASLPPPTARRWLRGACSAALLGLAVGIHVGARGGPLWQGSGGLLRDRSILLALSGGLGYGASKARHTREVRRRGPGDTGSATPSAPVPSPPLSVPPD